MNINLAVHRISGRFTQLALVMLCVLSASGAWAEPEQRMRVVKFTCEVAKSASDDPIVYPNQPGRSHLHDFYGNTGVAADTTQADDLARFSSNCGNADRSAYWTPALYQNGKKLNGYVKVYYDNKSLAAGKLRPFPPGYKIVMGNPAASSEAETEPHWIWACSDQTNFGHKPPVTCATGEVQLRSEFPNCWNGKLAPDGNAKGNVTWANGLPPAGRGEPIVDPSKNTCPAEYPIPLPMLRIVVHYPTGVKVGTLAIASNHAMHAAHLTGQAPVLDANSVYSKHGDFFNGWDQQTLATLIDQCLNTPYSGCEQKRKAARLPVMTLSGAGPQLGGFPVLVGQYFDKAVLTLRGLLANKQEEQMALGGSSLKPTK